LARLCLLSPCSESRCCPHRAELKDRLALKLWEEKVFGKKKKETALSKKKEALRAKEETAFGKK